MEAVMEAVGELLGVKDGVGDSVDVKDEVGESVGVGLLLIDTVPEKEIVAVLEGVTDGVREMLGVAEAVSCQHAVADDEPVLFVIQPVGQGVHPAEEAPVLFA